MIIVCRPVTEIEHLDVLEYVNSSLYRFGGQADARAAGDWQCGGNWCVESFGCPAFGSTS